ncbi:uncharacterized protein A4U43_C03F9950 [Asparagus officinalis]|uniref:BHLH domain-containing protein n=2 Tax=Asparagus officinalis TaxID=4686 RepID=A0A5P1F8R3_ASPOF|nr:uncharacterized protein A4U43_C03F9950 [Asparagus officinalis]
MEQRKKVTKLLVSPSLAVPNAAASGSRIFHQELAGASSSRIVAEKFSDPISRLKAPKQELMEQDTNLLVSTSLAAPDASAACIRNFRLELAGGSSSQNVSDPVSDLEAPISESMAFNAVHNPSYKLCPLPHLLSLEHHAPDPFAAPPLSISPGDLFSVVDSSNKRFRSSPAPPDPNPTRFSVPISGSRLTRSNEIGRQRRSKMSDRVTILEGLMPWKRKMTRGPMLEEAHTVHQFLEAQVTALQTMRFSRRGQMIVAVDEVSGRLELNRQQMLQVMMNSSMVQDLIYKKGCCVFSEEQVALLRHKMAMAGSSSASN